MLHHGSNKLAMKSIGVLDTGIGGLYAFSKIQARFPEAALTYIGDCRNLPHNIHPPAWICEKAQAMVDFLLGQSVDAIVIACHTISALRSQLNFQGATVYDIISPTLNYLQNHGEAQHFLFIGTRTTIESGVYQPDWLAADQATYIAAIELATRIEREGANHPETLQYMEGLLDQYFQVLPATYSTITLVPVCTHYFLVKDYLLSSLRRRFPAQTINLIEPSAQLANTFVKESGRTSGGPGSITLNQDQSPDFDDRLAGIMTQLGLQEMPVQYLHL